MGPAPGPTFVKTFLRTYAEYLGLDPRLLVEEYRQRYERPATQDLTPFSASRARGRRAPAAARGGDRAGARDRRRCVVAAAGVAVRARDARGRRRRDAAAAEPGARDRRRRRRRRRGRPPNAAEERRPRRRSACGSSSWPTGAGLRLPGRRARAAGDRRGDAGGRTARRRTFRSRAFRTNFGNDNVRMRVNGKTYRVAAERRPDRLRAAARAAPAAAVRRRSGRTARRERPRRHRRHGHRGAVRDHPRRERAVAVGAAA